MPDTAVSSVKINFEPGNVVRGENKQEFQTILNALLSEATLGTTQELLIIKMQAESYWKSQRAGRMEAGALDVSLVMVQIDKLVDQDLKPEHLGFALANAIRQQAPWFETLRRYANTAERAFSRATRELAMIRKAGPQEQIGYVPQTAKPEETKEPEIGYVPQKPPLPQHPQAIPRPVFGGMTSFAFFDKLENASDDEAMAFLDQLTIPKRKAKS
jgi:hypothetical protein